MKSVFRKTLAAGIAAALTAGMLAGCGASAPKLDGTRTALVVNGQEVTLGTMSFYAKFQQAMTASYYAMFGRTGEIFDTVTGSEGKTVGESMKEQVADSVTEMVLLEQHAADYGVSLTDEEKAAIDAAAQDYIDKNDEETRGRIGASKEDVVRLMELQTIQSKMLVPIGEEVDQNVDDAEAQQAKVTFVAVSMLTKASDETASEELEDTEIDRESETNLQRKADAEAILAKLLAAEDPASADINALAKEVGKNYSASTGQFSANDITDTSLDENLVAAVQGLKDGEAVDHVVENSAGSSYYVIRLDSMNDAELTESRKASILSTRKSDHLNEVLEGWRGESAVELKEDVWAEVTITDSNIVQIVSEEESQAETAEDTASAPESTAESAAESAAQ